MKKIYFAPKTDIVKVELSQMIAESIEMYGKNATEGGMSRRGSWDDDE